MPVIDTRQIAHQPDNADQDENDHHDVLERLRDGQQRDAVINQAHDDDRDQQRNEHVSPFARRNWLSSANPVYGQQWHR